MSYIYTYLSQNEIPYDKFEHEPVHTVEDVDKLPQMNAAITKNLFLRDKLHQYILVTVEVHKSVDLKKLAEATGRKHLSFASPEELINILGVEPGSVTLLGLINDTKHVVTVIIDKDLWDWYAAIQCHPLVNSASLVFAKYALERFFRSTGHSFQILEVPARV
jgi:Ala-tRNA(Pro) deacylase